MRVLAIVVACAGLASQGRPLPLTGGPPATPTLTLEVQRSEAGVIGDIATPEEWVTSMSIDRRVLRFRFGIKEVSLLVLGAPKPGAEWRVYEGPPPVDDFEGKGANLRARGDAGEIPTLVTLPRTFLIDFGKVLPQKPDNKTYYVNVNGRDNAGGFSQRLSPFVTLKYTAAAWGTTIALDSLKVLAVSPQRGALKGARHSGVPLDATNSIEITYSYELNSVGHAGIRQRLENKATGKSLPAMLEDARHPVKKGKAVIKVRETVRCFNKGQRPIVVNRVIFNLLDGEHSLASGAVPIQGVTFTCPDSLWEPRR